MPEEKASHQKMGRCPNLKSALQFRHIWKDVRVTLHVFFSGGEPADDEDGRLPVIVEHSKRCLLPIVGNGRCSYTPKTLRVAANSHNQRYVREVLILFGIERYIGEFWTRRSF